MGSDALGFLAGTAVAAGLYARTMILLLKTTIPVNIKAGAAVRCDAAQGPEAKVWE